MVISFDQYQRYKNAQLIINSARKDGQKFNILEVGANEHQNLEKFLPNDNITYLDIQLPEELLNNPKYILGDASKMDFEDNSFDIIVALDVYEHILNDRKKSFIEELERVSSVMFVICAPFFSEEVEQAEKRLNQVFKSIYNVDYIWLKEHIENKLPNFDELINILNKNNVEYEYFSHGDLHLWEKIMNMHFFSVFNPELTKYLDFIDSFYNENIFDCDYKEVSTYRKFVIGKKINFKLNLNKKILKKENLDKLNFYENTFYRLFNNKEYSSAKLETLNTINDTQYNTINSIKQELIEKNNYISQIYFDLGNGFSEENSVLKKINANDGEKFTIEFDFTAKQSFENLTSLRIDPIDKEGVIKFDSIKLIDKNGKYIDVLLNDYQTNADNVINNDIFVFNDSDPHIIINLEKFDLKHLLIDFDFLITNKASINFFKNMIMENFNLNYDIREFKINLDNQIKLNNEKIKEIENKNIELQNRDRELENKNIELQNRDRELENKQELLNNLNQKILEINNELEQYKTHYLAAIDQREQLKSDILVYQDMYNNIQNSTFWKMTKPARNLSDGIKKLMKSNRYTYLFGKGLKSLKNDGLSETYKKINYKLSENERLKEDSRNNILSQEDRDYQENFKFSKNIKFSILVPLYNTPENFLKEMIESVKSQTYKNWELCLADGSDEQHKYIKKVCNDFVNNDSRIKYQRLEENLGISENTNICASMATGDYIVLFDHDDLITEDALYENAKAIEETNADICYSDEDHITEDGEHINPFFKPDWSPDLLYSQMYICHLLVFKKELFDEIGGFDKQFDGAQDYDLMLRFSEKTQNICHIPKILYSWRETVNSTSLNADSKPYAHYSGLNALNSHLKRKYSDYAYAEETEYKFVYNIRYKLLENNPKISIIIPMKDKSELTNDCICSILEKSSYSNYEILILNNRSEKEKTFKWFKEIVNFDSRIKVIDANFEFNWSKLNNFGIENASGEVYIFLNNDTLVISKNWIEYLAENALRNDIGVVGPMLLYDDDTIQHAGIVVGIGGWADHIFKGMKPVHYGSPFVSPMVNRNVMAVTGACMAISKSTIENIGNFDEEFIICGSDVEICLRAYEHGLNNIYLSNIRLYHLESKSRDSYIPEIDFKKSYECYSFCRENGDPYFNINLDINSVIPKERVDKMDIIKYKNYLKRNPLTAPLYNKVRDVIKEATFVSYDIAEIQPINPREQENFDEIRLNLLVPTVDKNHVFGGVSTAIKFFKQLVDFLNVDSRIIVTDSKIKLENTILVDEYNLVNTDIESTDKRQLISFGDRYGKTIPVAKKDIFVATAWWTAYNIVPVIKWQKKFYKDSLSNKLIYFIQDYEPGFYPWSSRYLMADSTYQLDIETIAIFNSKQLEEFFNNNKYKYKFKFKYSFSPSLNENLLKFLMDNKDKFKRKKQILIYGRPSVQRNAFELIIASLKEWVNIYEKASEWSIISAGEAHREVEISKGVNVKSLGKLTLEEYSRVMLETSIGISLMVSPHPSYPPLEMATFGVKTITNCYDNKDMSYFSKNIISLKNCSQSNIANHLVKLCDNYSEINEFDINENYIEENTFDLIINEIKDLL